MESQDQHVQLGLSARERTEAETRAFGADRPARPKAAGGGLTLFVDRLLGVLSANAPETESASLAEFRQHLDFIRKELATIPAEPGLGASLEDCLKRCEAHLKESHGYHADREAELTEVIAILREAAALMAGDSKTFHEQVLSSSDKLGSMLQLEDIKEIRRQISTEVDEIRRAVTSKQKRDEEAQAQLTGRVEALQSRLARAEEAATRDPLTNVMNRGAFDRALVRMTAAATREHTPLSVAIIDIDGFKQINDRHGHPVGDRVLIATAQWIANAVRRSDFVARYGGEEFAVIFHDAPLAAAERRMREALEGLGKTKFEYEQHGDRAIVRWTASCGVTQMFGAESVDLLIRRADEALYEAKRKGKNRVVARKRSFLSSLTSR